MNAKRPPRAVILMMSLLLLAFSSPLHAYSAKPDLTAVGVIATLKTDASSSPPYGETYNLGPTGLRGWIYIDRNNVGQDGLQTAQSRQILVTVASTPGNAVLAVDDVILGAMAGSSGSVPLFTTDCRKTFGAAITDAEKTGAGMLRVKRWRAGTTTDENIPVVIMGDYSATAPYSCPKSTAILAAARTKLVSDVIANPSLLNDDFSGAVNGLALLAGVSPGDPNYATVQTRLQTYARSLSSTGPTRKGLDIWTWGYEGLFLSEYYLITGDANVLSGIHQFAVTIAQSQSMFGTFGHNPAVLRPDGSGNRSVGGYGPVNQAGLPANLAMVMCKKALVSAGEVVDPQIDPAIQHGSDFFASYVNRGSIPYGEHSPGADNHASNGKDSICAVIYAMQSGRTTETEYFTRMSVAGFNGREYGHTGQGFSFLWGALGSNMGGSLATSEYLKNIRWHLDLERRTDGSFVYDGGEQYGGGSTADGTYLGASSYNSLNPTASYILTYALPLQRLYITGKNAVPANTLDSTKVANAIAAATYNLDCSAYTSTQLIANLSEYDPVVRNYSAIQLAKLSLNSSDLTTLRGMISGASANGRAGACQTLGLLQDSTALPLITQRLDKNIELNTWVRAVAAKALRSYTSATMSAQRDPMLTAFIANATDPNAIDWTDPLQTGNGYLSLAIFGNAVPDGSPGNDIQTYTINAAKNLLYPAVKTGLKQPDSYPRTGAGTFCNNRLPITDVEALITDMYQVIQYECEVDRMWSATPRASGIKTMAKYHISEGIPLAVAMLQVPVGFEWGDSEYLIAALNALATYGDAARWTLPTLKGYLLTWDPTSSQYPILVSTIASIEAAITSPAPVAGSTVANSQVLTTTGSMAVTLTGTSPRTLVTFTNVSAPSHGTLTGTAPNLIYTPTVGYTGPDHFTFQTVDNLTTSLPGTVSIIVGTAGTGLTGEYFDNPDFTNLKLTRTDAQINFDWGTGSPDPLIGADTFSARWSGLLLVPETGDYMFSTLNSDGVRLYINGVSVIDDFTNQSTNWNDGASVHLTEGQMVDIQMEYYENTGSAVAKLKWTGPSFAGANGCIISKEWLFNGTGVSNRTPYANSLSINTVKNAPVPITLTGSGGTLTYTILNQPAHGTLTGTAPYVTYTPATDYSGTDGFTFLVNNGSGNSTPASASISIWAGQPVTCIWNAAVSGNWSVGANWTGTAAPASSGQPFYNLNFAPSGTYTVTDDLANGFQLTQMNMGGVVTLAGTNSLSFVANGTLPPQFNQNSASAVTVNTPLSLTAMTSFGGSGSGQVSLNALISGNGGLTKDSPGILWINNFNNTYNGGTVLNSGKVKFPAGSGSVTPHFGTGPLTINSNATLEFNRTYLTNSIFLNGGNVTGGNSFSSVLGGPVAITGITTFGFGTTGGFSITGNISGTGGLTTTGTTQWSMSGTNSYTGTTTIQAGGIRYLVAAAVAPGALNIASGGIANLNYSGTRVIASLTLGEAAMPPGTYGSTASTATNKNDTYFTSTSSGTVTVPPSTTTSLSLTGGSSPSNAGAPLTFTAVVTGSSPTGSVSFYANTTLLGTSTLNGSYQASLSTSNLAVGSYNITARYAGDATNAVSTSAALAVEIISSLPSQPTNLLASPGNNQVGLTWTISAGANSYYVKRSLTNGGPYTVISNPATASYTDLTATNGITYYYTISAINAAGESINSNQVSIVPAIQPSSTTLVSSPVASGIYGDAVTFTATVSVTGAAATGTVTFKDGTTVLGTGSLSSGSATFATSSLGVGGHSITASYSGDGTYATSVSTSYSYTVAAKSLTITGVTAANKVYDGNTSATLSGGTLTSGLVGAETVTVILGSGAFANPNTGTWAVTASGYALGGANAGNYALSAQPTVPNATITARPIQLSGTRIYDGTSTAAAGILTISNNVDGGNLSLTGSANLAGKDIGVQPVSTMAAAVLVQSASGNTGTSASTSFNVSLTAAPTTGNTLIAVISTRGTAANRVSAIAQAGASWSRASQATNINGTTTEIWYASNVSAAGTTVAITQASLRSAAVVMEYKGVLTASSLDQIGNSTGNNTTTVTGNTPITTQANELWVAGIGFVSSAPTLASLLNSFTSVAIAQSTNNTAGNNVKVYALQRVVTATATASSGGALSTSAQWSGAIVTFKTVTPTTLALTGSVAANYTLAGVSGSVSITPKPLVLTGFTTVTPKSYDGLLAANLTGSALQTAQIAGSGTTADGKPYSGDTVSVTLSGTFNTKDAGTSKAVTSTSILTGAQAGNYALTQPTSLTGTITPAGLSVTANNLGKIYGQIVTFNSGSNQFTSIGLQSGETIGSVTLSCTGGSMAAAAFGSPYLITPSAATGGTFTAGNYSISYLPGTLTIAKADQTISFETLASAHYGDAPISLTATSSSGLTVNYTSSDPTVASVSGNTVTILKAGSTTITASQSGDGNRNPATSVTQPMTVNPMTFSAWAAATAQGLTAGVNNGPMDDPDNDGISNLMEFALGGSPMESSQAILPKLTMTGTTWVFEYDRSNLSLPPTTTQVVEYGNILAGWTSVTVPTSSEGAVTITPGTSAGHVSVALPNLRSQTFVRLKVTAP